MAAAGRGTGSGRRRRHREEDPSVGLSKALSYVLRHGAAAAGLPMGPDGFVEVGALLQLPRFQGVSVGVLQRLVAEDPKGRFALRPHPLRIRANQGHSLPVPALELTPLQTPAALPPTLAHGTRRRCWPPIRAGGLAPMGRTHIHLAPGLPGDPGVRSGIRPDSDIAIIIDGPRALADGIPFFRSANGVILTPGDASGRLPPKYFIQVLQLRPRRCLLPLEGPPEEGRVQTPPPRVPGPSQSQ
ncbi:tRNA 2'-phosphotransferase 1 isoform X2 [Falco rusticolus]|uniref:tRNA 2'-phosphotransferase 1 isoform X2 n=1 Tax=Falco rusticolus TaxID=120794 RepID=UPI0018866C0A|nr:tRNA 2'-phosphotransferase 1 isoform X2 [Falco rusticolus]